MLLVRYVQEVLGPQHSGCDILTELGHLLPYVSQEGVGRPPSEDHYSVNGNLREMHRHRRARADEMRADIACLEAQRLFSHHRRCRPKCSSHVQACYVRYTVALRYEAVYRRVIICVVSRC